MSPRHPPSPQAALALRLEGVSYDGIARRLRLDDQRAAFELVQRALAARVDPSELARARRDIRALARRASSGQQP